MIRFPPLAAVVTVTVGMGVVMLNFQVSIKLVVMLAQLGTVTRGVMLVVLGLIVAVAVAAAAVAVPENKKNNIYLELLF